jgi:hypothetical protein
MNVQRNFLLLVTLAAVASPASGQQAARAVAPANSSTQGAPSIRDFAGVWARPSFFREINGSEGPRRASIVPRLL